jgi:hypothetical protein
LIKLEAGRICDGNEILALMALEKKLALIIANNSFVFSDEANIFIIFLTIPPVNNKKPSSKSQIDISGSQKR